MFLVAGREYRDWTWLKPVALSWVNFAVCSIFILFVRLSHLYSTACWSVWIRKIMLLIDYFRYGHLHSPLNWYSHLSTIKALWSPQCWDKFSFLYDSSGQFQHCFLIFMSTSFLLDFSEIYFIVGVNWSIIQNQQYCKLQQIFLEEQKENVKQVIHASPSFLNKCKWPCSDNKAEVCQIHLFGQVFWNTEVIIWKFHR